MPRFDVYAHPDAEPRKTTPYLLDVQNSFLNSLTTRVVIPLRSSDRIPNPIRDLNPAFEIAGQDVVLDTAVMAAFPTPRLKKPVSSFEKHSAQVMGAVDTLLGPY